MLTRTLAVAALLAPCACASVKVPLPAFGGGPEPEAALLTEHTALRAAADALSARVPQAAADARKGGLHRVVFGGRGDAERAAASAYLASLGDEAGVSRVLADADAVLAAGRAVAAAGMIGPQDAPSETDVALLEGAITDIQGTRRLLTTALRLLREEGGPVTKAEVRELGDAFVRAARQVGTAADMAAARTGEPAVVYADRPGALPAGY